MSLDTAGLISTWVDPIITDPMGHLERWHHIHLSMLAYFVSHLFDHNAITILPPTALLHNQFWSEVGVGGILLSTTVFAILQDAIWFATCAPHEYYYYLLLFLQPSNDNTYDIPRWDWTLAFHAGLFFLQLCLLAFPARLLANLALPDYSPYAAARLAELIHALAAFVSLEVLFCNVMLARMEGNSDGGGGGSSKSGFRIFVGDGSPKSKKKKKNNKKKNKKEGEEDGGEKTQAGLEKTEAEALVKGTLDKLGGKLPKGWSSVPCDVWVAPKA
jgi:hypothetical protein